MSLKNLNVPIKTRRYLLNKLRDKRTSKIYKKFESKLKLNQNFIVAVSGGPDSLALSFLAKIYSIKKSLNAKFFIVDHKLRKNSSSEVLLAKKLLKENFIKLNVLRWNGPKPKSNIQSIARQKRYELLNVTAKKLKIANILTGHHLDDLYENFFIRILRGSGLNGLVSLNEKTSFQDFILLRPLIEIEKKDLIYIADKFFSSYIKDPSNDDEKFTRSRIRKFIKKLQLEGLDKNKFFLTIKNLQYSDEAVKYFVTKNLKENSSYIQKRNSVILSEEFFSQPYEIVFRSLREIIRFVGKKYYNSRGRKLDNILKRINNRKNSSLKTTLGNCIVKKVNNSIIVSKEQ